MAVKLILTQIMKNESHVANRMLDSIKSLVDGIIIVDTGSTDNSIEIVKKWGLDNNIETHVFERPFDDFAQSRNHSFAKAREVFLNRNDGHTYYNFWLDFDEQLVIHPSFNKQSINKDLYMFDTRIGSMCYTRNELCRLDKPFYFYGVCHEFIVCDKSINITSGQLEGISVEVKMDGGSWQGNISSKYLTHAHTLEKYISEDRTDPRWIFYTAQSYHDSAQSTNKEENEERLRRSIKYYSERVTRNDGYYEETFYSQYRKGCIMKVLEEPWSDTLRELLKAYSIDPLRAESIKTIIDYYINIQEWNLAYLYSKFAYENYHMKSPYPNRLLFIDESLYAWQIAEKHAIICHYTNRRDDSKKSFNEVIKMLKNRPELFSPQDRAKIENNTPHFV